MNKVNLREEMSCSCNNCFDDNYFTNSLSQEYIAHLSYYGLGTEQNPNIIYPFDKLIADIKPKRVIEIGTFAGGLTMIMRTILDNNSLEDTTITTYDIHEPTYLIPIIESIPSIKSYTKNLFSSDYSDFYNDETKKEITEQIQQEGITLLLCDGGCKKCEFKLLSDYLKPNDVIMAHDYSPNQAYFENTMKNKIWNWLEIEDSDILDSCVRNSLESYMRQDFLDVAWVCKRKIK